MASSERHSLRDSIRAALRGESHDYTSGSTTRAVWLLAIPMMLEMAMESVFAICDIYFVTWLGDPAVAAVGLTESMITIVYAIAVGFSMATTALVSRRIGEKNVAGAEAAARQAILIGLCFGGTIGLGGAFFARDLLGLMGASDEVIDVGHGFTSVLLGTNVVIMLLFIQNAIFRGAGDAVVAMRSLWLANAINIVLDPCLIFGWGPFPEMGVTGAAVATTIGRGSGVAYQYWMLRRGHGRVGLGHSRFAFDWPVMRQLLRLSVGGVTQYLIATASWVALMRLMANFGDQAVAGYTIAVRIIIFALLPSWGLSNAATTMVGQNLGARRPDRAEEAVWITGRINSALLACVTVVFVSLAGPLVSIFTQEPETLRHGTNALRIISLGYVFYAWGMVLANAFNGAGDTMTPTRINLLCFWLFEIPCAWLLSQSIGPNGVFWSVAIAETLLAVVAVTVFRRGSWRTKGLPDESPDESSEEPAPSVTS